MIGIVQPELQPLLDVANSPTVAYEDKAVAKDVVRRESLIFSRNLLHDISSGSLLQGPSLDD